MASAVNALLEFFHASSEVPRPIVETLADLGFTLLPRFFDAPLLSISQDRRLHPLRTSDVKPFAAPLLVPPLLGGTEEAQGVQRFACRELKQHRMSRDRASLRCNHECMNLVHTAVVVERDQHV